MARLSKVYVARKFEEGDRASSAFDRGRALEDLLVYLFSKVPGVRLIRRNAVTEDGGGEIDLIFWNDRSVLDFLPNVLLFECKNWEARVDSAAVSSFIAKAVSRHLPHAFLIAANGVSGDREQVRNAHAHLHNALVMHDCKVVVLNRAELSALATTDQLIALIIEKVSEIYLLGV